MGKIFVVRIADIPQDGFSLKTEWDIKSTDDILADKTQRCSVNSPLTLDFTFSLLGTNIILDGFFQIQLKLICIKCLSNFIWFLEPRFRYEFRPESKAEVSEDKQLRQDDIEVAFYEGDQIDLRPLVREQIFLNLPQYPRCKEDCPGLCPHCGANLNKGRCNCPTGGQKENSPFSVLKKLKKQK